MSSSISDAALMVFPGSAQDNTRETSQCPARRLSCVRRVAGRARSLKEPIMSNAIKSVLLLGTLTALLVVIGQILGGNTGMIIALGFAVVMNFGSYWFSDQ